MLINCGSTSFFRLRVRIITNDNSNYVADSPLPPGFFSKIFHYFFLVKEALLLCLALFPRIATNFARNHTTAPYYRGFNYIRGAA